MSQHLRVLVRLARFHLDEERRRLGEAVRLCEGIAAERAALQAELAAESVLPLDEALAAAVPFARYAGAALHRLARIDERLAAAEREASERRAGLQNRWRECRTVELALEAMHARQAAAASHRERLTLDEIALQRHVRSEPRDDACGE